MLVVLFPHHTLNTLCLHTSALLIDKVSAFKFQLKYYLFQSAFAIYMTVILCQHFRFVLRFWLYTNLCTYVCMYTCN